MQASRYKPLFFFLGYSPTNTYLLLNQEWSMKSVQIM